MTTTPVMQHEVAVDEVIQLQNYVTFWATPDAAQEFTQFGTVCPWKDIANKYHICIDKRYDFDEVVDYLQNYGGADDSG